MCPYTNAQHPISSFCIKRVINSEIYVELKNSWFEKMSNIMKFAYHLLLCIKTITPYDGKGKYNHKMYNISKHHTHHYKG